MAHPVDAKLKKGLNSHHIVVRKTNICTTVLQKDYWKKKKRKKKKDKKIRLKIKNTVNHVTTNNNKHQTNIFCLIEIAKLSAQISGLVLPAYFSQTSGFGCRYCTRQRCSVSQASNKQAAAHHQRAATGMQWLENTLPEVKNR